MSRGMHLLLPLAVALLLSACATGYAPTPFWQIQESVFAGLKPGITSKDDVLKQVGIPELQSTFPNLNVDVWDYRYLQGRTVRMIAYVYFDPNGLFKYSTHEFDPAYYNAEGGAEGNQ